MIVSINIRFKYSKIVYISNVKTTGDTNFTLADRGGAKNAWRLRVGVISFNMRSNPRSRLVKTFLPDFLPMDPPGVF